MEWYLQPYLHRRDWILSHLEFLGLNAKEVLLALLIDYSNQQNELIGLTRLSKQLGLAEEEVEELLNSLMEKRYLTILSSTKGPVFDLSGLFLFDQHSSLESSNDLFSIFDQNFSRPLNSTELQKISDWQKLYDEKVILWALREALIHEKVNLPYMEACIQSAYSDAKKLQEILEDRR